MNNHQKSVIKLLLYYDIFDHMLSLMSKHGHIDLEVKAKGDIEVDFHHTVEDVGIVLGDALNKALGDRTGIVIAKIE